MREEKVKVALLRGESGVRSHDRPFVFRLRKRRRTSGVPAKT
jgi:hypothetical protein